MSVHLCVSTTQRALSLMQLRDDKSSGAEGERPHQETSPSQMAVRVGPHVDRVEKGPTNSWNFRKYSLTTGAAILSKGTPQFTSMPN